MVAIAHLAAPLRSQVNTAMQCSQPCYGPGFYNNFGQNCPYSFGFPQFQQPSLYPEIIGEGEVASVQFPDGSIHLYFIPLNKRFATFNYHQNHTAFCNNATGAYYVRGISNPITPAIFSQQCQKIYPTPIQRTSFISNCNLHRPPSRFQLKFHNDCWTSTTDLHYFFPCLRQCDWYTPTQQKGCVSVQGPIPVNECAITRQETVCNKPCLCCQKEETPLSECVSSEECVEKNQNSKNKHKSKASKHKLKLGKKKSSHVCMCQEASTDKSIATVADQSTCCSETERNTQTNRKQCAKATSFAGVCKGINRDNVKTEIWTPNTSLSAKTMQRKSCEKLIGIYETCSSNASCCCSTDGE